MLMNDKVKHAIAGAIAASVGWMFWSPEIGLCLAVAAGAVKELFDLVSNKLKGHTANTVDILDFVATIGGGTAIWLLSLFL